VLILSRAEVESALHPDPLIEALAGAMADLSAGRASMPLRTAAVVPGAGFLGAMPAFLPGAGVLEAKLVSVFSGNAGTDLPTHQAVIVAFDPATGRPEALLDATSITELRTAAGSALATRLLAREEARTMSVLGTGAQARAHLRAVSRVRRFEQVWLAGRSRAKADPLADEVRGEVDADGHPGYLATATLMGEAGLLLAEPGLTPDRSGCLTPAAALGTDSLERFERAGARFRVEG
jgi:ornithine cyclodeaminase